MLGSPFARFAIASVLPVVALVSCAYPSTAQEGYSTIKLPVEEIANGLKGKTNVPIFIPESIPIGTEETVYWSAKATETGYEIMLEFTPDCQGTYCYVGAITAERGGQFSSKNGARIYEGIQLQEGLKALHTRHCGVQCQSNLEWKLGGVLYKITIKEGVIETLVGAANSAISGGQR